MNRKSTLSNAFIGILLLGVVFSHGALAAEDPDELYQQGRFAEAEKAYASSDMDHPKDVRYRYNRGCSAFQNSDYQGAMAAFSSVMRRAKDDDIRSKTAYNLGNTAFKQGDFQSAAAYYKQAIRFNPKDEDAKHNLELAVRELEKLKQQKDKDQHTEPQKEPGQEQGQGDQSKSDQEKKDSDKSSGQKTPDQEQSEQQAQQSSKPENQTEGKSQGKPEEEEKSEPAKGAKQDQGQQAGQASPQDLSGDLKPMENLPEDQQGDQTPGAAMSMIDKKKAEALLDNIKENRAKFLQFRVPEEKKYGVSSGRDW
jgi:Ca-activated chloride channel family protein